MTPHGGTRRVRAARSPLSDAQGRTATATIPLAITAPAADVVISQVYGGGGNAGADYRNDFIELRNREAFDVSVAGWSVQYASSAGTSWAATPLTGMIPAGGYYLVQEAAGAGGTLALPTPDATGTIAMSGHVRQGRARRATSRRCPARARAPVRSTSSATAPQPASRDRQLRRRSANTTAADPARTAASPTPTTTPRTSSPTRRPQEHARHPPDRRWARPRQPRVASGRTRLLTVTVTPGAFPPSRRSRRCPSTSPRSAERAQPFFDDGTHGDVTAGDGVYSYASRRVRQRPASGR